MKTSYKNIIIGFGKGGKTLAEFLAKKGESVALIERSPFMYGGTCINVACIPTKALIVEAEKGVSYTIAHSFKDKLTSTLREKNYEKLANNKHFTIILGEASFLSTNKIHVKKEEGDLEIVGERIFINTGTAPFIPNIKGINGDKIYDSTTFMALETIPKKVTIIGAGFIGLEFASMLLHYGCQVTILDSSAVFLSKEDRDISEVILQSLTQRGLKLISNITIQECVSNSKEVTIHYDVAGVVSNITSDAVLVATGRTPQTKSLNLVMAGVKTNQYGYINVDDKLRTDTSNIWAIGDVHGGAQFTYTSLDDFRIIKNQLYGGSYDTLSKRRSYPTSVFITPPYARIGMNEIEAKEKKVDYKIFTLSATMIPKAMILKQKEGFLKAIVENKTGQILGCMFFCAESHELINIVKIAMDTNMSYEILRDNIYTHPTMAESLNSLFSE